MSQVRITTITVSVQQYDMGLNSMSAFQFSPYLYLASFHGVGDPAEEFCNMFGMRKIV